MARGGDDSVLETPLRRSNSRSESGGIQQNLPDGTVRFLNSQGDLHNSEGPAVITPNQDKEFWLDGVKLEEHSLIRHGQREISNSTNADPFDVLHIKKYNKDGELVSEKTEKRYIQSGTVLVNESEGYPSGGVDFAKEPSIKKRSDALLQEIPLENGFHEIRSVLDDGRIKNSAIKRDGETVSVEEENGDIRTYRSDIEEEYGDVITSKLDHFTYKGQDESGDDLWEVENPSFMPTEGVFTFKADKEKIKYQAGHTSSVQGTFTKGDIDLVSVKRRGGATINYDDGSPASFIENGSTQDITFKEVKTQDGSIVQVLDASSASLCTRSSAEYILGKSLPGSEEFVNTPDFVPEIAETATRIVYSENHLWGLQEKAKLMEEQLNQASEIKAKIDREVEDYERRRGLMTRIRNSTRPEGPLDVERFRRQVTRKHLEQAQSPDHLRRVDLHDYVYQQTRNLELLQDNIKSSQELIGEQRQGLNNIKSRAKEIGIDLLPFMQSPDNYRQHSDSFQENTEFIVKAFVD